MKRLLIIIILALVGSAQAQHLWTGIIAPARGIDWTQQGAVPGSPGLLPDAAWMQCGSTLAAGSYNGSTIASTLSGCAPNTYYKLGAGTFSINGSIAMPGGGGGGKVALRGSGEQSTILNFSGTIAGCNGTAADICMVGDGSYPGMPITTSNAVQWTGGYSQGTNQITLSSVSGITANKTMLVLNQCDTGFSGLSLGASSSTACTTGSSIDNGGYFFCSPEYVIAANDSGTVTVSGGVNVTGTGFSAAFGSVIVINSIAYVIASYNSATSITLQSPGAPNGSGQSSSFPTGCGSEGPDTGAFTSNDFQQEVVMVTAINAGGCGATCVTISHPLYHPNWNSTATTCTSTTGQCPIAILVQAVVQDGVESLTINGSGSTNNQTAVGIQDCYECFVSNVEMAQIYEFGIYPLVVSQNSFINNYLWQSNGHPDAYGIRPVVGDSDLTQNNIFQQWKNSFACDGPCVGEVVSYNYSVDQIVPAPSDQMWGSYWTHSAGDDFMLREGNIGDQAQDDNTHGAHLNQTSLRQWLWGFESCVNGFTAGNNCGGQTVKDESSTALILSSGSRYANQIGNILGTPGFTTTYQSAVPFGGFTAWNIGGGNAGTPLPTDPLTGPTSLRWGNWDSVNAATLFCTAPSTPIAACPEDDRGFTAATYPGLSSPSTTIPTSFIYSAKPNGFGSVPWPPIGPDVSGGSVGQCSGTINTTAYAGYGGTANSQCASGQTINTSAWAGHVNPNPAFNCYLQSGGLLDGTGGQITLSSSFCLNITPGAATVPSAPSKNMLLSSNEHIRIGWQPSTTEDVRYYVDRNQRGCKSDQWFYLAGPMQDLEYEDYSAISNKWYYYVVKAHDAHGYSGPSNCVQARIQ